MRVCTRCNLSFDDHVSHCGKCMAPLPLPPPQEASRRPHVTPIHGGGGVGEGTYEAQTMAGPRVGQAGEPAGVVGLVVGNFQIEKELGGGGMAKVYSARHLALGTEAVVKVMHRSLAAQERQAMRFLHEARTASSLHHPHIVRIYDFGKLPDGMPYMVMEYIPGRDLSLVIEEEGRMDPARAMRILRQVASALDVAHTYKEGAIVHRDLKPDNIRVTDRDDGTEHATVLDFGIARTLTGLGESKSRMTLPGTLIGTPAYMSPEQALGQPLDTRSDIYSFGVVAYEMLTGKLPFEAQMAVQILAMHIQEDPEPIPDDIGIPPRLAALVMRCLEKDRDKRPQTARDLAEELDSILDDLRSAEIRRRAKITVAAVLLIAAAVVAAVWFGREPEGPAVTAQLTSLEALGRTLGEAEALYTRDAALDLEGVVEVKGPADAAEVELRRGDSVLDRATPDDDGAFALRAKGLQPGERVAWGLVLSYEAGEGPRRSLALAQGTVTRDTRPPSISLDVGRAEGATPLAGDAGLISSKPSIRLPLVIRDESPLDPKGFTVEASGGAKVESATNTAIAIDLKDATEGPLDITLRARDVAGNAETRVVRLTVDRTPPALTLQAFDGHPIAGPVVLKSASGAARVVPLEIRAQDAGGLRSVRAVVRGPDGAPQELESTRLAADGEGAYRFQVPVGPPGSYEAAVRVEDAVGLVTEAPLAFTVQLALQVEATLTLGDGEDAARVAPGLPEPVHTRARAAHAHIEGNQTLERASALLVAGDDRAETALALDGSGRVAAGDLDLVRDAAQEVVISVDAGGRRTEHRFRLVQDSTPPVARFVGPAWPETVGGGLAQAEAKQLPVQVAVEDAHPAGFVWVRYALEPDADRAAALLEGLLRGEHQSPILSDKRVPIGENGQASLDVPIADGTFLVVGVEALDRAGNSSYLARRSRIDLTAPRFAVRGLGRYKLHERFEVVIDPDEPVQTLTVNGELAPRRGNAYVYAAPMLLDTVLTLDIQARDPAGNVGKKSVTIERELVCSIAGEPLSPELAEMFLTDPNVRPICPVCGKEPILKRGMR